MPALRKICLVWFACLSLGQAAPPAIKTLVNFASESPRLWQSGPQPAQISVENGVISLPLNFRSDDRQITLTCNTRMDLQHHSSFRLRIGILNPEVLLEGTLAFKSAAGWYSQNFTLHERGFHHLLFSKADFKKEGNPGSWQSVEAIRLSFWPRKTGIAHLQPLSLDAFVDTLWLLDPESLAETPDETYTARVSLRHFDRLLSGIGLPHAVLSPAELNTKNNPALIIIPYLPRLPQERFAQLTRLIDQGSKIIVFESAHQGFARKLDVELVAQINSATVGQFDHLAINQSALPQAPRSVYQHAWDFRSIRPLGNAVVSSVWQDALDRNTQHAGSIDSSNGVWVNVAWRSGDVDAKQKLLSEWIGRMAPELLIESLRFYQETKSPRQFEIRYGNITASDGAPFHLKAMAEQQFENAAQNPDAPLSALRALQKSDQLMQRAYASGQEQWKADLKGIWDQNGTGYYAGSWDKTCKELKAAGFNAVFPNMASAGRAHYPSKFIPPSKSLELYGDQLKAFTKAAHRHGLEAHAWKICWKLNTRLPAFAEKLRREGRLMADASGKSIPWLSLSHPDNVQFEIDSLLEMAGHAPIDGIQLDYMRYPGREADYGPAARKAYESRIGRKLPNWPREVLGPLKDDFQRFRQQEVHNAVQKISTALKKAYPNLTLSVAVWGAWPDCADAQGQDWPVWAGEGWVDWVIPMNYTDNPDQFAGWLDLQRAQPGVAKRLIPGIGLISSNAELSPVQLIEQLKLIEERKLPGALIYRLDSSLESRVFPFLKIWK
jgi:uncharacterized lipoprotein YddW (UPF0748 family)